MTLKSLILGSAAVMVAVSSSQAADSVFADQPVTAPDPIVTNWAGFYLGGQVGGAWSDGPLTFAFATNEMEDNGFVVGAHAGYDFQVDRWVLGVVGDINFTDLSDTSAIPAFATINSYDVDRTYSIRGRLGYLVNDSVLAYATGGWAFADVEYTNQFGASTQTINETMDGYVIGGGIEWAASDQISAYVEYTHADYGDNFTPIAPPLAPHTFELEVDQVVFGISFRYQ